MIVRSVFACLLLSVGSSACGARASSAAAQAPAPAPAIESLPDAAPDASGWGSAAGLRYFEILRGGARANETLPLLLVIHGMGDKPQRTWLEAVDVDSRIKARMILPQAPAAYGGGFSWFHYRAANLDQTEFAREVSDATEQLARMIAALQKLRPTRGRAVVTGFSQGGMLSYALALRHPELFDCAVPISGMLPTPLWPVDPPGSAHVPRLRALHGTDDTLVRMAVDELLVARLHSLGYAAELVPFPGVGHAITPAMSALVRTTLSEALAPPQASPARRGDAR